MSAQYEFAANKKQTTLFINIGGVCAEENIENNGTGWRPINYLFLG
jgi:hypothetical protein